MHGAAVCREGRTLERDELEMELTAARGSAPLPRAKPWITQPEVLVPTPLMLALEDEPNGKQR
ncbi:MAG TPA: hypothetical protein VF026_24605 [Ktedonobacteraceae bacterium]